MESDILMSLLGSSPGGVAVLVGVYLLRETLREIKASLTDIQHTIRRHSDRISKLERDMESLQDVTPLTPRSSEPS